MACTNVVESELDRLTLPPANPSPDPASKSPSTKSQTNGATLQQLQHKATDTMNSRPVNMTKPSHRPHGSEKTGRKEAHDHTTAQASLALRAQHHHRNQVPHPDALPKSNGLTNSRDNQHSAPIDVPRPKTAGEDEWGVTIDAGHSYMNESGNASFDRSYQTAEDSALDEYMRNRRPSITFSPEIKLDTGARHKLDEPLPKLAVDTSHISQQALRELENYPVNLQRAHSEADIRDFDTVTGEPLGRHPSHFDRQDERESDALELKPTSPPQRPVDGAGVSGIAQAISSKHIAAAPTPIPEESTSSDEDQTMEILLPSSAFPSFAYPASLEDSSAWPRPRRQASASAAHPRSFNPEIGRSMSMRAVTRRQSSRRSTSSSMSPATAFLSRFARDELQTEPDGEGQVVGDYVLGKQVGYGGFSEVKEAFTIEGDERISRAVKIVRKQIPGKDEQENERLQSEFEHEMQLWRCLSHRNVLPLMEVYDTDFATFCFTKLNTGGTLFDKVRANRGGLERDLTRRYAYQLASALRYLHEDVRIVHRDVKLENCLIDDSDPTSAPHGGNLLLCDFGLAEFISSDDTDNDALRRGSTSPPPALPAGPTRPFSPRSSTFPSEAEPSHRLTTSLSDPVNHVSTPPPQPQSSSGPILNTANIAGSLQYASPELILSPAGFLSPVVDIWAYGVVLYALIVGDLPFQHVFQPRVQMMILAGEWNRAALEARAARPSTTSFKHYRDKAPATEYFNAAEASASTAGATDDDEEVEAEVAAALELVSGCLDMRSDRRWIVSQVLTCRWLEGVEEGLSEEGPGTGVKL